MSTNHEDLIAIHGKALDALPGKLQKVLKKEVKDFLKTNVPTLTKKAKSQGITISQKAYREHLTKGICTDILPTIGTGVEL